MSRPLGRSRSFKVTDFGSTNRKLIYDFLLVINTNVPPILHRFRDRSKSLYSATALVFNFPDRGVPLGRSLKKFRIRPFYGASLSRLNNRSARVWVSKQKRTEAKQNDLLCTRMGSHNNTLLHVMHWYNRRQRIKYNRTQRAKFST